MSEPKPQWPLKANHENVLLDLLGGKTQAQIAAKYGVARQVVDRYIHRHQTELEALRTAVQAAVVSHAIADKQWRIGEIQNLYDETAEWQQANGLTTITQRFDKDGSVIGESRQFSSDVVRTRASLLRQAAEEMDHLPRNGNQINIDARTQTIRLSWSDGEQA